MRFSVGVFLMGWIVWIDRNVVKHFFQYYRQD